MFRSSVQRLGLLGPLTVAAALGIGTLPALAQTATDCSAMSFSLANPSAGSRVENGGITLSGTAMDSRAQQGTGIDRIQFFLDSREAGGTNLGSTVPGMSGGTMGPNGFSTTVMMPGWSGDQHLYAYARSSVTGQESIINIPFTLGVDPTRPVPVPAPTAMMSCSSGSNSSVPSAAPGSVPPMPAATIVSPSVAAPLTASTSTTMPGSTLVFSVSNPSAGNTISAGGLSMEGWAYDSAAAQGTGVDRIDIFLDDRDAGGLTLGRVVPSWGTNSWRATVMLPSNKMGQHRLFFDAHSSVTGADTIVSIPITIAP